MAHGGVVGQLIGLARKRILRLGVATRLGLSNKLNNDVVGFKKDEAAVKQYRSELETQLADDRSEIDRYYRLTKELAAKKAEMEEKLSKLIDENTKKAAAEADGNP